MSVGIKSGREQRTAELGLIDSPVHPSLPVYTSTRIYRIGKPKHHRFTPYNARNCHKGNDIGLYTAIHMYSVLRHSTEPRAKLGSLFGGSTLALVRVHLYQISIHFSEYIEL